MQTPETKQQQDKTKVQNSIQNKIQQKQKYSKTHHRKATKSVK